MKLEAHKASRKNDTVKIFDPRGDLSVSKILNLVMGFYISTIVARCSRWKRAKHATT